MIHLRSCVGKCSLCYVSELQTWLNLLYQKLYKERKSGDFIKVFPSIISVLDTLFQLLHRMWELWETVGGMSPQISIPDVSISTSFGVLNLWRSFTLKSKRASESVSCLEACSEMPDTGAVLWYCFSVSPIFLYFPLQDSSQNLPLR